MKRANGTGSIYRRTDGLRRNPWVACVSQKQQDGKIKQILIGSFATRKEAMLGLEKHILNPVDNPNITFKDVFDDWFPRHREKISKDTIDGYTSAWEKLKPLHDFKMRSVKTSNLQDIIDTYSFQSKTSVNNIKTVASLVLQHAMRDDIITQNYASYLELEYKSKKNSEIFTDEEIGIMFEHDSDPVVQVVLMLIYTGYRPTELLSMNPLRNINLEYGYMRGGIKTEAGKDRVVPISPKIMPYVKSWIEKQGKTFICLEDGSPMLLNNFRENYYKPTFDAIDGVRTLELRACRRTFATIGAKAGIPEDKLIRLMGHTDISTTKEHYIDRESVVLTEYQELEKEIAKI